MSPIEVWLGLPLSGALGWALLHSLWQGVVAAALVAGVLVATRSPLARYGAACLAMLGMVAAFVVTLGVMWPEEVQTIARRTPVWPAAVASGGGEAPPIPSDALAAAAPWLAAVWIAGVSGFYLYHAAGWLSVRRLRRRGVCRAPGEWQDRLSDLAARMRVLRPVALLESCLVDVPVVLGHLRPVILMPVGILANLPASQVEAILLHELAHIGRRDYLVNLFQRLGEGLFFYHPAVWWISHVIRVEREHCCDDAVVAITGDAHRYAMALAELEQTRLPGEPVLAATGGDLMRRIRRLLYPRESNASLTAILLGVVLLSTAVVAVAAWQAAPQQEGSPETSHYVKWLNEDVAYIIEERERQAFLNSGTDEERERFIEQFWLRRDPTPGTAANEFRDEHYRRVEFANARFWAEGRPGWRTDRGRMYIVYGPPDAIENRPNPDGKSYAFQHWRYRYIEGLGHDLSITFVDKSGSGCYTLAPGFRR
ncbi:MAG: M56 family metallopeptidase [Bryobacteraceae bacterium]